MSFREPPLVSCLCVTEDRPAFLPWVLWNYDKQDHQSRELVVVDSSREPANIPERADVRVLRLPPGTSVAAKRNAAVEAARGSVLTWFDDDDWQHPGKLSILAGGLTSGAALAGPSRSWFVDLRRMRTRPHAPHRGILFNGLAVRRSALTGVQFDERVRRAADTAWVTSIRRRTGCPPARIESLLFFWLCHDGNISNPASRYVFTHPLSALRDAVGAPAWTDTDAELAALRDRLGTG